MPNRAALTAAIVALMGANAAVEEEDLGGGRRAITLRNLPKPEAEDDPRFFRHNIAASLDVRAPKKGKGDGGGSGGEGEGEDPPAEDEGEGGTFRSLGSVRGVASSTSVDFYGTEMSLDALEIMKSQLESQRGVPLLPSHGDFFSIPEWDSVIGRSISAEIKKAKVAEAYDKGEQGYILDVEFALLGVDKARELRDRLDADQEIGLSIGGWFTALSVIYNEETDELERIIVLAVQLDHVASTRMPANPDSMGLTNVRSAISKCFQRPQAPSAEAPVARDAVRIGDTEALARRVAELVVQMRRAEPAPSHDPAPAEGVTPVNRTGVTPHTTSTDPLDTGTGTSNDDPQPSPAARSTQTSEQETDMTPEQIEAIVKRAAEQALEGALPTFKTTIDTAVRSAVDPIEQRLAALEAKVAQGRGAPAPDRAPAAATLDAGGTLETDEVKALRSQVARLQEANVRLATEPVRRGRHGGVTRVPSIGGGIGADSAFRSIVEECRGTQVGMTLAAVVERHIDVLSETDGAAKVTGKGSVRNLQRLLASGLRAAEADGLINKPAGVASWH